MLPIGLKKSWHSMPFTFIMPFIKNIHEETVSLPQICGFGGGGESWWHDYS